MTTASAEGAVRVVAKVGARVGNAVVLVTLLIAQAAHAQAVDAPAGRTGLDTEALLARIQRAAQHENYVGTFVHQQGNQVQSSRITHLADRAGEHEKLELLDGQEREFIRHNDDVRCFVPDSKLVIVEKRAKYDSFPALLTTQPADLDSYYQYTALGPDRVAGRPVLGILLEARDQLRYGYRLWYDRDTALLLKAQTIDSKGTVIEQVAFSDVAIAQSIDRARLKPSNEKTDGWRIETGKVLPVDLTSEGWAVRQPVPGFRKVMEFRRAFGGRADIGQIVFSDGLGAISVFIEPGGGSGEPVGAAAKGPMHMVTRTLDTYRLTVVGDAPAAAVRQMADAIEFTRVRK